MTLSSVNVASSPVCEVAPGLDTEAQHRMMAVGRDISGDTTDGAAMARTLGHVAETRPLPLDSHDFEHIRDILARLRRG